MPGVLDELFTRNRDYARRHGTLDLAVRPRRRVVIVTCMDSRIDAMATFGLELGDAHIIRNAGARVTDDMLRSIAVSMGLLETRYVVLLGHTRCGLSGITDDQVRARIRDVTGASREALEEIEFLATDALEEQLRTDCERLLASPLLPADAEVAGGVFDVDTGLVTVIVEPRRRGG